MSKPLHDRLKKNHVAWTDEHTKVVKLIKNSVKFIPCLFLANPVLPKIVETDASDLGYGGILNTLFPYTTLFRSRKSVV